MPYPAEPGFKQTGTSADAAAAVAEDAEFLRQLALKSLAASPKTPDEIAAHVERHFMAIRPRCSELKRKGLVTTTGRRRRNASGKMAAELRLVTKQVQGKLFETSRDGSCL